MKKFKYSIILFALIISSCEFEKKTYSKTENMVLQPNELIGNWVLINDENNSPNLTGEISKFELEENKTVEITVQDSTEVKVYSGRWKMDIIPPNGVMMPAPGLFLDYHKSEKDSVKIILAIEKNNNDIILFKSGGMTFGKK